MPTERTNRIHTDFNPMEVPLVGANLIEASAGTGKTYSIAILALRLVLEKKIPVDKILMVTFTRDAAAEMKLRVRGFIRQALQAIRIILDGKDNFQGIDPSIVALVQREGDYVESEKRLQLALLSFDQASIFTIHSFCARILGEYAFETGQIFQATPVEPAEFNGYMEDVFNQLWREQVTVLEENILTISLAHKFSRDRVLDLVKAAINGKKIYPGELLPGETKEQYKERILRDILNLGPLCEEEQIAQLISVLADLIFTEAEQRLTRLKEMEGLVTFDDMITGLHKIICSDNLEQSRRLIDILQSRYSAVFIDEFQDTDQFQFDIFFKTFRNNPANDSGILFFIGDPKQSIYAFRKADLQTYFKATTLVDDIWQMNTNYRSTANYVKAMNQFFQPKKKFDVFKTNQMLYHPVGTPDTARTGQLMYEERALNPLRIICCDKKPDIIQKTVQLVARLLFNPKFQIQIENNTKRIRAGQIGILIRSKKDGRLLQERLSDLGIPAVTVSDTKVFETSEALDLLYILKAVQEIKLGSIQRALLTKIVGFGIEDILKLDIDQLMQKFRDYQTIWNDTGIYNMLRHFISDSEIVNRKLENKQGNADRILANIFQLMEMLHEAETDNKYSPDELIFWLKKGIDGDKNTEDQYLQRIESDASAVKIVTMHSCKGLEYDIVIAPFLDMYRYNNFFKSTQFRTEEGYFYAEKKVLNEDLRKIAMSQTEQENLRLLYVAITRARYHCYILSSNCYTGRKISTALRHIQNAIIAHASNPDMIRFIGDDKVDISIRSKAAIYEVAPPELFADIPAGMAEMEEISDHQFKAIPNFNIQDWFWQKTSYSQLNPDHSSRLRKRSEIRDDKYDEFVFSTLAKGSRTGNFIHDILERIDFSNHDFWLSVIRSALKRYSGIGIREERDKEYLTRFLEEITSVVLMPSGFSLNVVTRTNRLNELEFHVPLTHIDWHNFPNRLEEDRIPLRINRDMPLTGILNGKIDLFFEYEGMYYLLDWKSNHLGNRPEDYNALAMAEAMEENNYYLQYYLYSLALYRYLSLRMGEEFNYQQHFGGVYYLFVRGMRTGTEHGIYFHKPIEEDLKKLEVLMLRMVGDAYITQ